jgi:hypothetical protein
LFMAATAAGCQGGHNAVFLRLNQPKHRAHGLHPAPPRGPGKKQTKTSGAFFRRKTRFPEGVLCFAVPWTAAKPRAALSQAAWFGHNRAQGTAR